MIFEKGRVCVKVKGRDAGQLCVVLKEIDKNTVLVACKGRKKARKCAIVHLEPTAKVVGIGSEDPAEALKQI